MEYEVTATRKRPQSFDELIGQEFVVATLKHSLKQQKIAHAYLFSGPRGVGKTSAARILAKALNCETGLSDTPCGVCSSCTEITQGNSLDVLEIDGASNTSVNDVREIKDEVLFAPNSSRYKVYIIDEVHMLSNSAFNALLKTIEEPPPYVVFVFATTELHKVPPTIRSRCQQFNFRLIGVDGIKQKLHEVIGEMGNAADEEALFWIAKESTGSMRDAYTLLDQIASFSGDEVTLKKIVEKLGVVGIDDLNTLVGLMIQGSRRGVVEYIDDILHKGISVEQFVIDLTEFFRNLLFLKHDIRNEAILGFPADSFPGEYIESFSESHLEKAIELLLQLYRNLRFSLNPKFEFELLMVRFASLKELITPQEIIQKIHEIRSTVLMESGESTETEEDDESAQVSDDTTRSSDLFPDLIDSLKREKLTLASSLEKVASYSFENDALLLHFLEKDRFFGELVEKEKEVLHEKASQLVSRPVRIEVQFTQSESRSYNKRVETIKKVFRGEIVKGEQGG